MAKNLVGRRIGMLLVVEKTRGRNKQGHILYRCLCDCGNECYCISSQINDCKGHGKWSCGCTRRPNKNKHIPEESAERNLYRTYKNNAKMRGLVFDLSKSEFGVLIRQHCHYCGIEPNQKATTSHKYYGSIIYNGIDRVDNSEGYTLDNCVPCCGKCNKFKYTQTKEEFLSWVERVYDYSIKHKNLS